MLKPHAEPFHRQEPETRMALDQKKTMYVAELTVLIRTFHPVLYTWIKVKHLTFCQ